MSIHWPIIRQLVSHPTRVAVVDDRKAYKGYEILAAATHVAAQIEQRCTSDTVGVLLPCTGAFPICALAAWMTGKTLVPLNFMLKPEELDYVVGDCGADTILTSRAMLDHLGFCPLVKHVIELEDINFKSVPPLKWPVGAEDDDLAVLLYTSGTSGKPKGVMLTHANIQANVAQCEGWVGLHPGDSMVGVLPQFHSFGLTVLTLLPLTVGLKVVYTARFKPMKLLELFREHRPRLFVGIPSMYTALVNSKSATSADFSSIEFLVSGGEPLPDAVSQQWSDRFGGRIAEGYGLTETAPVSNWCRPFEYKRHSVGKALTGIDQRIRCIDSRRDLGVNAEGEIVMKGPNVMCGYYGLPDETSLAFEDGFFRTGDIGKIDADGHLFITGRLKEMLIVGGENVFPREIEEVINRHPKVAASGVVGKDDGVRGEVPVAFVELCEEVEDREGVDQEVKAYCRENLAGYKVPREVRVLDALPRNPTGKILRRELKPLVSGVAPQAAAS
ncbi:MAG: AMP-binding protein [Planctomycetota bacterium]